MKKHLLIIACFLSVVALNAQELNCDVKINSSRIQGTNRSVFNTLQNSISEFLNNRKWTDMTIANNERIDCSINIIVATVENDVFTCELQVQSRRPVYNSSYTTTLFNFRDTEVSFEYKEYDPMEINQGSIVSNLTAVLAYYAYVIIGYDLDSYSRYGGTGCFQAAEQIVNMAQSTDYSGWKAFQSDRNRYTLINNLMDEAFKKYRNYFYEYHRFGLDEMAANMANARARIATGLPILREANRARPSAIVITTFLDAKNDELINIFSQATEKEKKEFVSILSDVNPTYSDRYDSVMKK